MTRPATCLLPLVLLLAGCGGGDLRSNVHRDVEIVGNTEEMVVPKAAPVNVAAPTEAAPGSAVRLAADGLSLSLPDAPTERIPFGTPRAAATRSIAGVAGDPIEQGDNQECGAGPLSFANFRGGLALYFQDGKFAGWDLDGREGGSFATAQGIGVGATRSQLDKALAPMTVEDTTIGIEFRAGGLSGLLSSREANAEVTNLWAGVTCIAR